MMSMATGVNPSSPISNLTLQDPRCINDTCRAFAEAHAASQAAVSFSYQFQYGHWATWFYLALIALFTVTHGYRLFKSTRHRATKSRSSWIDKLIFYPLAVYRSVAYRRFHGPIFDRFGLPSVGILLSIILIFILAIAATFAIQPYYRGRRGFGSPPIAVRTGLMAVACTPILFALAGKANFITWLTGYGHEKLNVFHRYTAWICFFLSIVHTVPFIVAPLNDGGYAALTKQFYKPGGFEYTGVPPLAMLFGLVLFSLPWVRHRMYETFWHLHVVLAILYLALMFWHTGQEGDSWAYLWASLALLLAQTFVRLFYYNQAFNLRSQWFTGSTTNISVLPGHTLLLKIQCPGHFTWRPGQHCYIRFVELGVRHNHPFTIANISSLQSTNTSKTAKFLARSNGDFTKSLLNLADSRSDAQVVTVLDGPYGGYRYEIGYTYHDLILVAGGAGISACIPWLQHIVWQRSRDMDRADILRNITLIWMVRRVEHTAWQSSEILQALCDAAGMLIKIEIHVTDEMQVQEESFGKDCKENIEELEPGVETQRGSLFEQSEVELHYGRPQLSVLLQRIVQSDRTFILACGPESLKIDVSNACAALQSRVLNGAAQEIKLHTETFGW